MSDRDDKSGAARIPSAGTEAGATRIPPAEDAARSRAGTYAAVVALEALVIVALWAFSRHFSA